MAQWNHHMCDACWILRNGKRVPVRLNPEHRKQETCCFCGRSTHSGIFVRHDPKALNCACEDDE